MWSFRGDENDFVEYVLSRISEAPSLQKFKLSNIPYETYINDYGYKEVYKATADDELSTIGGYCDNVDTFMTLLTQDGYDSLPEFLKDEVHGYLPCGYITVVEDTVGKFITKTFDYLEYAYYGVPMPESGLDYEDEMFFAELINGAEHFMVPCCVSP